MTVLVPFHTAAGMIDLANLRDEDMTAMIIGDSLAKIPRFNGRTGAPWSVAAHSLLVEHLCPPDLKAWGLLHDAHEAFLGDITSPALELICLEGEAETVIQIAVDRARHRLDFAIARAWGCTNRSHSLGLKQADWIALQAEMAVFFGQRFTGLTQEERRMADSAIIFLERLPRLHWRHARDAWIARAQELALMGLLRLPVTPSAGAPADHPQLDHLQPERERIHVQ